MPDEATQDQVVAEDRTYEPPTVTVLGEVAQLTSESDSSEPPK